MIYFFWNLVLVLEILYEKSTSLYREQPKKAFGDSVDSYKRYLCSFTMLSLSTSFSALDPASTQLQGVKCDISRIICDPDTYEDSRP